MTDAVIETRIPLRWADTDALGHIYHAVHVQLIDEARGLWLDGLRAPGAPMWDHAVIRLELDFRAELRYEDEAVIVSCRGTGFGTRSVRTHEQMRTPAGTLVAEARTVVVAWDQDAHAARPLTGPERALLETRCVGLMS